MLCVGYCGCSLSASAFYCCYYYLLILFLLLISFLLVQLLLLIFIKSSLLVLWDKLTVWFCSFYFFIYLNLIHATTIGVDALSQYYHLASFNYGDNGHWPDWYYLSNIMPGTICGNNWKAERNLRLFLLSGVGIIFDNNCRGHS